MRLRCARCLATQRRCAKGMARCSARGVGLSPRRKTFSSKVIGWKRFRNKKRTLVELELDGLFLVDKLTG